MLNTFIHYWIPGFSSKAIQSSHFERTEKEKLPLHTLPKNNLCQQRERSAHKRGRDREIADREIIESSSVRSANAKRYKVYTERWARFSVTLKACVEVPFNGAFSAFPTVAAPDRSNIKISDREKRKHAPAYKRVFPLYRDPAFFFWGGGLEDGQRSKGKGVERW